MNAEYDNKEEIIEEDNQENFLIQEDQFENDDQYMLELQRRVAMMKNERKQAEKDSQLLFNRLNLLKGEEEKVFKYIIKHIKYKLRLGRKSLTQRKRLMTNLITFRRFKKTLG